MDQKLAFTLDPARSAGLAAFAGKEVVLGLRPENFANGTAHGGAAFEAVIQSLEPAGADTYAHVACNGISFIARVSSKEHLRLNQKREVSFEPGHARWFDAATGEAIPLLETNS
jgi:multiple sugar transport system ATP-binding protein